MEKYEPRLSPRPWCLISLHSVSALIVFAFVISLFNEYKIEHFTLAGIAQSKDTAIIQSALKPFSQYKDIEDLKPASKGFGVWRKFYGGTDGALYVQKNRTGDLVADVIPGHDDEDPWGVSMFHGIHCLQIIRDVLIDAMSTGHQQHDGEEAHGNHDHVGHCFAYLAQSLMCSADTTIEPPQIFADHSGRATERVVSGLNVAHKCRDSSRAIEMMLAAQENAPGDSFRAAWTEGARLEDIFN